MICRVEEQSDGALRSLRFTRSITQSGQYLIIWATLQSVFDEKGPSILAPFSVTTTTLYCNTIWWFLVDWRHNVTLSMRKIGDLMGPKSSKRSREIAQVTTLPTKQQRCDMTKLGVVQDWAIYETSGGKQIHMFHTDKMMMSMMFSQPVE